MKLTRYYLNYYLSLQLLLLRIQMEKESLFLVDAVFNIRPDRFKYNLMPFFGRVNAVREI